MIKNINNHQSLLESISRISSKPPLYQPGESLFWDDPHISKSMLAAHLNPDNDLASRKHATIDREVEHLVSSGILKAGDRLLDLGCGPGLYSRRLAGRGSTRLLSSWKFRPGQSSDAFTILVSSSRRR